MSKVGSSGPAPRHLSRPGLDSRTTAYALHRSAWCYRAVGADHEASRLFETALSACIRSAEPWSEALSAAIADERQ